mgnify:CR=1 FL=1
MTHRSQNEACSEIVDIFDIFAILVPFSLSSSESSSLLIDDKTKYESTSWDENVTNLIEYVVGEEGEIIPKHPGNNNYYTYIDFFNDYDLAGNDVKTKFVDIEISPLQPSSIESYAKLLERNGFIYSSTDDLYYAKANKTDVIYVVLSYMESPSNALNIAIYRKTIRYAEWDNTISTYIIGENIPHIDCGCYEYYFYENSCSLDIYFVEVNDSQIATFKSELVKLHWVLNENNAYYESYTSSNGLSKIMLQEGVDTFNDTYLCVTLSSDWPYFLLYTTLEQDLPHLSGSSATYTYYEVDQLDDGTYYFSLGYTFADSDDFNTYCTLMGRNGWKYDETTGNNPSVSHSDTYGDIYSAYFTKLNSDKNPLYVDVYFTENSSTQLLIIIYA